MTKLTAANIRNTTNKTYAICVAVPAMPDRPNRPAIIATTRNVTAQLSIVDSFRQDPLHRNQIQTSHCTFWDLKSDLLITGRRSCPGLFSAGPRLRAPRVRDSYCGELPPGLPA